MSNIRSQTESLIKRFQEKFKERKLTLVFEDGKWDVKPLTKEEDLMIGLNLSDEDCFVLPEQAELEYRHYIFLEVR
jgi:hypothetical protein